jgi:hypothetical protein
MDYWFILIFRFIDYQSYLMIFKVKYQDCLGIMGSFGFEKFFNLGGSVFNCFMFSLRSQVDIT